MTKRWRAWLVLLLIAACPWSWGVAAEGPSGAVDTNGTPSFTFMQFSDVHAGHELNRPVHKRLVAAVKLANELRPAFVIDSGDMTTHPVYEASGANLAEYAEYKKYTASLTMPLYNVPGNHDIGYFDPGTHTWGGGKPWGNYEQLVAAYRREIGPLDQAFAFRGVKFILLNNNPAGSHQVGHLSDTQFEWLEDELESSDRTFLFCHVQVLENGTGPLWGESAERLGALCQRYRVEAVGYGHQHNAHIKELNGTQYIMCPDLKNADHQAVYQYRVFPASFELWRYDVFSREGVRIGSYPAQTRSSPAPLPCQ